MARQRFEIGQTVYVREYVDGNGIGQWVKTEVKDIGYNSRKDWGTQFTSDHEKNKIIVVDMGLGRHVANIRNLIVSEEIYLSEIVPAINAQQEYMDKIRKLDKQWKEEFFLRHTKKILELAPDTDRIAEYLKENFRFK